MKAFANDNYSPVAAEILQAMLAANNDHQAPYGKDDYTKKATVLIKQAMGRACEVALVTNGTAANVLALSLALTSYHSVLAATSAHLVTHEVGAVFAQSGAKLVTIAAENGKLTAGKVALTVEQERFWGAHNNQPRVLSITQATEVGTVYTAAEIKALADCCRQYHLYLHMDGCRIYNAAVALDSSIAELVQYVDILSLGGTKNGLMFAEACVVFHPELMAGLPYLHKQVLQLYSKMRYLAVQYIPFLEQELWHRYASQANQMATKLATGLKKFPQISLKYPQQTNQIFAYLPSNIIPDLQLAFPFYVYDNSSGLVRLATSFDTQPNEVEDFLQLLAAKLHHN